MNDVRYTVGSVTGYVPGRARKHTVWYIHDSAYCYRVVMTFRRQGERYAQKTADLMNGVTEPPMPWGDPRHGTLAGSGHLGCACPDCVIARREYTSEHRKQVEAA